MAFPAENKISLRALLYVAAGVILIRGTGMLALNQKLDGIITRLALGHLLFHMVIGSPEPHK